MANNTILIRGLDKDIVARIDQMAADRNLSREKFMRVVITNIAMRPEMKANDNKHQMMVDELLKLQEILFQELMTMHGKINSIIDHIDNI